MENESKFRHLPRKFQHATELLRFRGNFRRLSVSKMQKIRKCPGRMEREQDCARRVIVRIIVRRVISCISIHQARHIMHQYPSVSSICVGSYPQKSHFVRKAKKKARRRALPITDIDTVHPSSLLHVLRRPRVRVTL